MKGDYNLIIISDYKGGELSGWAFNITLEDCLDSVLDYVIEDEIETYEEFKEKVESYTQGYAGYSGFTVHIIHSENGSYDLTDQDYNYLYEQYKITL